MADDIVRSLKLQLVLGAQTFNNDLKQTQRELRAFERSIEPTTKLLKGLGTAILSVGAAGVALGVALGAAVKSAADYGDEINDAAKKTGLATEQLSRLRLAAETSGSSFEGLQSGLKLLGRNIEMATSGSREQIRAFAAAGISAKDLADANGDVNKILIRLADTFVGAQDGAGKTAVAMALMGRSGDALIPMLNEGAAGLKRWGEEADRAGRTVTAEAGRAADEFNDSLKVLQESVLGLTNSVGTSLIPSLTTLIKEMTAATQGTTKWIKENKAFVDLVVNFVAGLTKLGILIASTSSTAQVLGFSLQHVGEQSAEAFEQIKDWAGPVLPKAILHFGQLEGTVKKSVDAMLSFQRAIDAMNAGALDRQADLLSDAVAKQSELSKASDAVAAAVVQASADFAAWNAILDAFNKKTEDAILAQKALDSLLRAKPPMGVGPMSGADEKREAEEFRRVGGGIIDQLSNDIGRMFTDAISHGKSFWEAFKDLGKNTVAAITKTFLDTMIHGFLDPFKEAFGRWQESITKWIQSNKQTMALIAGGAAIGGVAGGKSGAVAGALGGAALGEAMKGDWIGAAILGIAAVGAAFTGMIKQLHQLATKFVNEVQNKMTDSVTNLFAALEDARDMGSITVKQVADARRSFEKMWTDFQASAAAAGIVGQQGLATMTPFIASWRVWLDMLDESAASLERLAKVMAITDRVTKAADGFDVLEQAIQELMDSGTAWEDILTFLGGDIERMVDTMKALKMEVPPALAALYGIIRQFERLAEVEAELTAVTDQLASTLIQKMGMLDSMIADGTRNIEDWTGQIADLNTDVAEQSKLLQNAAHWQKEYDNAIRESADTFKRLTDERADVEKRIKTLSDQITREALVDAVNNAKASATTVTTMIETMTEGITRQGHAFRAITATLRSVAGVTGGNLSGAQAALDAFDARMQAEANAARLQELTDLQRRLPEVIRLQKDAESAYALASVAAQVSIDLKMRETLARIAQDNASIGALQALINAERAHIAVLELDRQSTQHLMDIMGIARLGELEGITATVNALIVRGAALEKERAALLGVVDAGGQFADMLNAISGNGSGATTPTVATPAPTVTIPSPVLSGTRANQGPIPYTTIVNIDTMVGTEQFAKEVADRVQRGITSGGHNFTATEIRR